LAHKSRLNLKYFAAHVNENLTAARAGDSPAMIHAHYKGLATNAEAEKWFAVAPKDKANIVPLPAAANESNRLISAGRRKNCANVRIDGLTRVT
jgi:hypothetical protein